MSLLSTRMAMLGLVATLLLAGGCSDKDDPVSSLSDNTGNSSADSITYLIDTKAVFDARCTSCHATSRTGGVRNGAPVGVNFDTYTVAAANAVRGNTRVQAGTMPPTGTLPQNERELIQLWLDQGLLE